MTTNFRKEGDPPAPVIQRVAGATVVALGVVNMAAAVLVFASGQAARMSVAGAVLLGVLGAVTAAVGMLVWRGSRPATITALALFAILLLLQVAALAGDTTVQASTLRAGVLAVVVALLAAAARSGRRRRATREPA